MGHVAAHVNPDCPEEWDLGPGGPRRCRIVICWPSHPEQLQGLFRWRSQSPSSEHCATAYDLQKPVNFNPVPT